MPNKKKAFEKTLKAVSKTKLGEDARDLADKKLSELGLTEDEMAYAAALAKAARDKALEYEFKMKNLKVRPRLKKNDSSIGIFYETDF